MPKQTKTNTTLTKNNKIRKSKMKSTGERVYTFITEVKQGKLIKKKFCTCCEQYKDYAAYHKSKRMPEGLNPYCKDCSNKANNATRTKASVEAKAVLESQKRPPIAPVAEKQVTVEQVIVEKTPAPAPTTAVAENFALLTNRLSLADEVRQLRLKEATLLSVISALANRNGGKLELTKTELEYVGECSFDLQGEMFKINSGKVLAV